ncbi:hypothetical protein PFLUV_G00024450 [Perca fluviatilis]|uniref:Uncharacterized protein n=1 Tax=Perca fluviatilis TaxID=8168 RepID=A0A6A5FKX1_PERFL|nr:hypothetical protein PFLUV_G00024450 [Perca fluviatilis]
MDEGSQRLQYEREAGRYVEGEDTLMGKTRVEHNSEAPMALRALVSTAVHSQTSRNFGTNSKHTGLVLLFVNEKTTATSLKRNKRSQLLVILHVYTSFHGQPDSTSSAR